MNIHQSPLQLLAIILGLKKLPKNQDPKDPLANLPLRYEDRR